MDLEGVNEPSLCLTKDVGSKYDRPEGPGLLLPGPLRALDLLLGTVLWFLEPLTGSTSLESRSLRLPGSLCEKISLNVTSGTSRVITSTEY